MEENKRETKLLALIGLVSALAAVLMIWLLLPASSAPDLGQRISTGAFMEGIDAVNEELSGEKHYTTVEIDPEPIVFSLDAEGSVFFSETVTLTMTCPDGGDVYYTTDGTIPTVDHGELYTKPITLKAGKETKAYHFMCVELTPDFDYSKLVYRTYFVGHSVEEQLDMLVFSIDAAEEDLWSAKTGIFSERNINNRGRAWERPMHMELYSEEGIPLLSQFAGMRIYGAYSRTMRQKPMRFISRSEYDLENPSFEFDTLFGELYNCDGTRVTDFSDLILRNAGNDYGTAFMRDEVVQTLMKNQGFVFTEEVRPCLVFVNGTLYGLYWLHEPYKEDYFENRFSGYHYKGEFVVLDGPETGKLPDGEVHKGFDPLKDYKEMLSYGKKDLTDDDIYAELCSKLDVDSYLRLNASMAYVDNGDWPQNNNRVFKYFAAEGEDFSDVYGMDGKWYFVPHDTDWAFFNSVDNNTLLRNYDQSQIQYSALFSSLMKRDDCVTTFVSYLYDMMNFAFEPETMAATIESITAEIRNGIGLAIRTSPYAADNCDEAAFERRAGRIATYALDRAKYMKKYIDEVYGTGIFYQLEVSFPENCAMRVNTIYTEEAFSGTYDTFYDTWLRPVIPMGYEFESWTVGNTVYTSETLLIRTSMIEGGKVKAKLSVKPIEGSRLIITKATYYTGKDALVITNVGSEATTTLGWAVSDDALRLRRYPLPVMTIGAGESITVLGETNVGAKARNTFSANFDYAAGETLFLTYTDPETKETKTVDSVHLYRLLVGSCLERNFLDGKFYEK